MWDQRRLGRFAFSEEFVMPPGDQLWMFYRDMVILEAFWNTTHGRIEYVAWSARFRALEEGEDTPIYIPQVVHTKGAKMVEWREAARPTAGGRKEGPDGIQTTNVPRKRKGRKN